MEPVTLSDKVVAHPALLEFAARQNAETVTKLLAINKDLNAEIHRLRNQVFAAQINEQLMRKEFDRVAPLLRCDEGHEVDIEHVHVEIDCPTCNLIAYRNDVEDGE